MTTALLDGNVTDQNGVAVPGALIYVYDGRGESGDLADLSDSLGQSIGNPVTAGEDGYWSAYAASDQFYTLVYFWGGRKRYVEANVLLGNATINTDPNVRSDLEAATGASRVGFTQDITGSVDRTVEAKLREAISILDFGAVGDGTTDNSDAFAAAAAYAAAFSFPGGCTINVPSGTYAYDTSPNWGVANLELRCASRVTFVHTGTGVAFLIDGGASGDGIFRVKVTGKPMIRGSAGTTYNLDVRAISDSHISATLNGATVANVRLRWSVCTTYDLEAVGLTFGGQSPMPVNGLVLDQRSAGEQTSANVFTNLRVSHISGAGLLLTSAIQNTFVGGAAEICGTAISVAELSSQNTFTNFDMEVNSAADINCSGNRNTFFGCLSSTLSVVSGSSNNFIAGLYNAITVDVAGDGNQFVCVAYAAAAGLFTDNSATTGKLKVRNLTTGLLDNDIFGLPTNAWILDRAGNQRLYFDTTNSNYYRAISNHRFTNNDNTTLATIQLNGVEVPSGSVFSVNGQQVVGGRLASLPADATDLASAITLLNAIKARLKTTGGHGLVAD